MLSCVLRKINRRTKKPMLREICRDEGGMTLVELICGLAVAAIILTLAGGLLMSVSRLAALRAEQAICRQKAEAVSSMIEKQVMYADRMKISRNPSLMDDYEHSIRFTSKGTILLDETEVFSSDRKYRYYLYIENCGKSEHKYLFEYTIRLEDGENQTLSSVDNVVNLVNLDLAEGSESIHYPEEETEGTDYNSRQSDLCLLFRFYNLEEN